MIAQPPGFRPSALRVATHGQQVATMGGGAVGVFYSSSWQGDKSWYVIKHTNQTLHIPHVSDVEFCQWINTVKIFFIK